MLRWSWLALLIFAVVELTMASLSAAPLLTLPQRDPLLIGPGHLVHRPEHFGVLAAVGVWAGRRGGHSLWVLPLSFLAGMALGFLLGVSQPESQAGPYMHYAAFAATLALVAAAASALPVPSWEAMGTLMLLGMCQGYVDGAEAGLTGLLSEASLPANAAGLLTVGSGVGLASTPR